MHVCLHMYRYVVLANILAQSDINPFAATEAKVYQVSKKSLPCVYGWVDRQGRVDRVGKGQDARIDRDTPPACVRVCIPYPCLCTCQNRTTRR